MSLALLATIVIGYLIVNSYLDADRRLPAASTRMGKEVRAVILVMLIPLAWALMSEFTHSEFTPANLTYWALLVVIGVSIPVYRYIQFRKRKK